MLYVHILNTLNKNIQISLLIYFLLSYFLTIKLKLYY